MKERLKILVCCLSLSVPLFAEYQTQSFPSAHELFLPLQADPTEPRFGLQMGAPVNHHAIAHVEVGDYLGVYRWALPLNGAMQLNVGGAIFTRFDGTSSHSLQVIDYYGNIPLDIRIGRFSMRTMFYHNSSHLGDDYLRERNLQSVDHSWEALRQLVSIDVWQTLRLYGGYTNAIHTKPAWPGRSALQGGIEIYLNPSQHAKWHPYWANDVQSWERSNWTPTWTSQLGFKTGDRFSRGRGISYFIQYSRGPRFEGQFFNNRENIWSAGLKFELTDRLIGLPPASETPLPESQNSRSQRDSNP